MGLHFLWRQYQMTAKWNTSLHHGRKLACE
jgi:hypothetical protein